MAVPGGYTGLRLVVETPGGRMVQDVPNDREAWAQMVDGLNEVLPEGTVWWYEPKDTGT